MILTMVDQLEGKVREILASEGATADQGCSALANLLLRALVKAKKDPAQARAVSDEMKRLAATLMELSALEGEMLDRGLADVTRH